MLMLQLLDALEAVVRYLLSVGHEPGRVRFLYHLSLRRPSLVGDVGPWRLLLRVLARREIFSRRLLFFIRQALAPRGLDLIRAGLARRVTVRRF